MISTEYSISGEILVWDLAEHVRKCSSGPTKDVGLTPLIRLRYPNHNVKYLNLGFSNGMLGVGDDQGSLVLYNLEEVLKRKADDDEQENIWEASLMLEWPNIVNNQDILPKTELVVNTVAISSSHEFITGGTDNNLVCIWKRDSQSTSGSTSSAINLSD